MNSRKDSRSARPARLPTALLSLAILAGSASVGHAEEIPTLIITADRPVHADFSSSIRDEMRDSTEVAVWMTRISVGTDLGVKLGRSNRSFRLAAADMNKRG